MNRMGNSDRISRLSATALSNLVLLVGLFLFNWDPRLFLLVYWFEAGVAVVRDSVQGLFAERPPSDDFNSPMAPFPFEILTDVRGGFRPVRWLPPVYPRNVPYVLLTLIPWLAFWPLGGILLAGYITPFVTPVVPPVSAAVSILAVILSQVWLLAAWIRKGEYEAVAATGGGVSRRYLAALFVVAFVAPPVIGILQGAGIGSVGLAVAIVACKVGYDLLELRTPEFVRSVVFDADPVGETSSVAVPEEEPIAEFHADRRGAIVVSLVSGAVLALFGPMLLLVALAGLFGAILSGAVSGHPYGAVVGVGLVVTLRALAQLAVSWVVGFHAVYRVYPDAVVEWNELTGQPQWAMARDEIAEVTVAHGRLRSLLPDWFGAVRLSGFHDESRLVGYISDPKGLADLLNRST